MIINVLKDQTVEYKTFGGTLSIRQDGMVINFVECPICRGKAFAKDGEKYLCEFCLDTVIFDHPAGAVNVTVIRNYYATGVVGMSGIAISGPRFYTGQLQGYSGSSGFSGVQGYSGVSGFSKPIYSPIAPPSPPKQIFEPANDSFLDNVLGVVHDMMESLSRTFGELFEPKKPKEVKLEEPFFKWLGGLFRKIWG